MFRRSGYRFADKNMRRYLRSTGVTTRRALVMIPAFRSSAMAAIDDDDRPKRKITHDVGQDLALLSVEELGERIALLNEEIARLEQAMAKKRASRTTADQF